MSGYGGYLMFLCCHSLVVGRVCGGVVWYHYCNCKGWRHSEIRLLRRLLLVSQTELFILHNLSMICRGHLSLSGPAHTVVTVGIGLCLDLMPVFSDLDVWLIQPGYTLYRLEKFPSILSVLNGLGR